MHEAMIFNIAVVELLPLFWMLHAVRHSNRLSSAMKLPSKKILRGILK